MNRFMPHVTVAAIARRDDQYLLVRESSQGESVLNQPAGHLEASETLTEAVVRETLEETCWQFNPLYLTGIYQFVAPNQETYIRLLIGCHKLIDPSQIERIKLPARLFKGFAHHRFG